MAHVLIHNISRYVELVVEKIPCKSILVGCVCYKCGSGLLKWMNSLVDRGVQFKDGFYEHIKIRLVRCMSCNGRERALPYDILPGKTNDVNNILSAVSEAADSQDYDEVGKKHGVTGKCVQKWMRGLYNRSLDIFPLYRHRAIKAPAGSTGPDILVPFSAFVARTTASMSGLGSLTAEGMGGPPDEQEIIFVIKELEGVLDSLGGVANAAKIGAEMFRQGVLLFRDTVADTSSSIAIKDKMCIEYSHEKQELITAGSSLLAFRANRGNSWREESKQSSTFNKIKKQRSGRLAERKHKKNTQSHPLSVVQRLPGWRDRGPPEKGKVRSG